MALGSHDGAEVSVIYHTFIETCKMCGVSTLEYFKEFFKAIMQGRTDYENMLPMTIGIEFFHPEIEQKRKTLMADIGYFGDVICVNTFPGNRDDLQTVPPEWEEKDPRRFREVVNSIHAAAQQACIDYDDFVKFGKREIKI